MRPLLLAALLATQLAGCGAVLPMKLALATPPTPPVATQVDATAARRAPDGPPVAALDCDRDGLVSLAELSAGFVLNRRAVTAEEFAMADLTKDGLWNATEFARFLNHRPVGAWSLTSPCQPAPVAIPAP